MANLFNSSFNPASLSQDQQELLMAALTSNRIAQRDDNKPPTSDTFDFASGSLANPIFSPDQIPNFGAADINSLSDQQFLDFLGSRDSFDFDSVSPADILENQSPPAANGDGDLHDKRKNPEDDKPDNENGAKRREGEEKVAKKPGRKPLTSEPTSVSFIILYSFGFI
jgi:AP-1-like transcription factor